jgi:RNA recognition motif-containing protein
MLARASTRLEFSNLSYRTNEQTLINYFNAYGYIDELSLERDDQEQSLRRGYLVYNDVASVDNLMLQRPHTIDQRQIVVRRFIPDRSTCLSEYLGLQLTVNELFISRLCAGETKQMFINYFQCYGKIVDCRVFHSRSYHGHQMGYAFLHFADYDSVGKLCTRLIRLEQDRTVNFNVLSLSLVI